MKTSIRDCVRFVDSLRSPEARRLNTWRYTSKGGYDLEVDDNGNRVTYGDDAEIVDEKDSPVTPPSKDTLTGCPYPPGSGERLEWLSEHYSTMPLLSCPTEEGDDSVSPFEVDLESALCRILGGDVETDDSVQLPTMSEDFAKWATRS